MSVIELVVEVIMESVGISSDVWVFLFIEINYY